jgi:hypothetical protein
MKKEGFICGDKWIAADIPLTGSEGVMNHAPTNTTEKQHRASAL